MNFKLPYPRLAGMAIAVVSLALSSSGFAQENPAGKALKRLAAQAIESNPNLEYNPYTLIVKYRTGTAESGRSAVRAQVGGIWLSKFQAVPGLEVISTQIEPSVAAKSLSQLPWVEYAEVDYTVHADVIPNDAQFGQLWGLHNTGQSGGVVDADIDAPEAWDMATGSSSTRVAVIDTGVQYDHPDLAANIWTNPGETAGNGVDDDNNGYVDDVHGYDFANNDGDPRDDNNHGTHCSGTIGGVGNNGIGVAGVNWNVKIVALKFLGASGSGSTTGAIGAINYCIANNILVSSNSWGGGGFSQALFDAITAAGNIGHIFVAAAGNNNSNNDAVPFYPASYTNDNLISVAAIDRFDARSSFSNYGANTVDLGAPGTAIYSTVTGNSYATFSGTSMATPHVSGAVALLWSYKPGWSRQQVKENILATVRPTAAMAGRSLSGGVLNVFNSLTAAGSGSNTAPTVTITGPSNGASFIQGTSITFTGTADDPEDGPISGALVWTSSINNTIGSGSSFSTSGLKVGTHVITALVMDSGGLTGNATISITVTAPPPTTPNAPSNLVATKLRPGVRLNWSDNSANESGFRIERQVRSGKTWGGTFNTTVGTNVTSYTENPGSGQFRYRVQAFNASGNSAWTSYINVKL